MLKEEQTGKEKEISEEIAKEAKNGKISCAAARKIAEELEVDYKSVGEFCNREKIKIAACDLGCF